MASKTTAKPDRIVDSPNQDERPAGTEITLLVVHSISLPPGEYGGDAHEIEDADARNESGLYATDLRVRHPRCPTGARLALNPAAKRA